MLHLCVLASTARAELVTVRYEAEASTVVDQPFGIDVPRLTVVRGFFTYQSDTPDQNPGDLRRGSFKPVVSWGFRAEFLGHVVSGSNRATGSTETFGHTLRFNDGGDSSDTGDMSFDHVPTADLALGFAIVGGPDDLPTDQLPKVFRFDRSPHTFSLGDDLGRMLLQFRSFSQVVETTIKSIDWSPTEVAITWCSVENGRYAVEFSTDLKDWLVIRPLVIGEISESSIIDDFSDRSGPDALQPLRGFYRVRELGPPP